VEERDEERRVEHRRDERAHDRAVLAADEAEHEEHEDGEEEPPFPDPAPRGRLDLPHRTPRRRGLCGRLAVLALGPPGLFLAALGAQFCRVDRTLLAALVDEHELVLVAPLLLAPPALFPRRHLGLRPRAPLVAGIHTSSLAPVVRPRSRCPRPRRRGGRRD